MRGKNAQVWIETVIYTLIGLSIIGIVMGIVKPSIDEKRDSLSIKQGVDILNSIDGTVNEIKYTSGNSRELKVRIGRGKLFIEGLNDIVEIVMDSTSYKYSEPNAVINAGGNVKAITLATGKKFQVTLYLDYQNKLNITYKGKDAMGTLQATPSDYNLLVLNRGAVNEMNNIDFSD